jgi:dephospho-CoA kinase
VLSTDAVVHALYGDPEVAAAVSARFGVEVLQEGEIDRGALARTAFAAPEDRAWLESLLWPRVGERMVAWRNREIARCPPPRALIVEVPLLFESGMEGVFEATIAVAAPEDLRAQRAASRGHHALDERAARQLSQEEKAARATFAVTNDGGVPELEQKLSAVLDMLAL